MDNRPIPEINYAVIAAGEGARLQQEGVRVSKPLVEIDGVPMIDRLIAIFLRNGAKSISVICNEQMPDVREHLEALSLSCPLYLVVQSTPSSMHSLAALSEVIPEGKFCLTTVDTIFEERDFASFIRTFAAMEEGASDGLFAVTPFVDDEKPLWVAVRPDEEFLSRRCGHAVSRIEGFYDKRSEMPADADVRVSGGIYCLHTLTALPVLRDCLVQGQSRMRNYQRALIAAGLKIDAYTFPKILDIDHASDIEKAEFWLKKVAGPRALAVSRAAEYSPNNEEKDAAIFSAVIESLQRRGWQVEHSCEGKLAERWTEFRPECFSVVFHMARRTESLKRLEILPLPVVNAPGTVRLVARNRTRTLEMLREAGIMVPASCGFPAWVKAMREDGARPMDVCFVSSQEEADIRIQQLRAEGVQDVLLSQHVEGELVKCYAVQDEGRLFFCRWFRPQECGYSKFGEAEQHNTRLPDVPVIESDMRHLALRVGKVVGLQVYGFDVILQPDGQMTVIDVNDCPSFSICREEAAEAIAMMINNKR